MYYIYIYVCKKSMPLRVKPAEHGVSWSFLVETREVLHAYGERGRRLQQALLGERSEVSPIHEPYRWR